MQDTALWSQRDDLSRASLAATFSRFAPTP
jgi:hypothetical protein